MSSTVNHPFNHQAQSEGASSQGPYPGDGLLPQYFDGYRVVDRLGGGAMATVYRAVDIESNQEVALKVLAPGADDILRERFRVEARTVSVLSHPHIVQTLRVGQVQNGFPYIAMELVEGDSLATLLERQNQLSVADSCLLLEPIARALSYAHSHHVVHRDVKPSNILLRHVPPGTPNSIQLAALPTPIIPLLSDFGIARALDAPELTTVGRTIGTPAYMSPEQCAGTRNLDGRADIYSLATVLYRCLVGRPPFMGATTQILHAHVYEALTIPEVVAQILPPAMLSILQRALQKSPDDRYADMALFANDVAALLRYIRVQSNGLEEATLTLPLLAALQPEQEKQTVHVLVSGTAEQTTRSQPPVGRAEPTTAPIGEAGVRHPLTGARTTQSGAVVPKPETASGPRRRKRNWAYIAIGTLLSVALLVLVATSIMRILPNIGGLTDGNVGEQAAMLTQAATSTAVLAGPPGVTATVAAVVTNTVDALSAALPTATVSTTGGPTPARTSALGASPGALATTALTSTAITPNSIITDTSTLTTTVASTATIDYDIGNIWKEDVLFFYYDRDWRQTRRRALEVFSSALEQETNVSFSELILMPPEEQAELIAKNLLDNKNAAFWARWQAIVPPTEVQQVLFDTYVGIANEENKANRPSSALANFDAALLVRNDKTAIATLSAATARYANAIGETTQNLAAQALSQLYTDYATEFAAQQSFCSAAEYLDVANALVVNSTLGETLQSYQQQCRALPLGAEPEQPPAQPEGAFIYSTEENGIYRIYRTPIGDESRLPVLLVENGSQPSLSADGRYMAFYSRRSDAQGISLVDLTAPPNPQAIFPKLTNYIEDSLKSAPSWSPEGNRLTFSSNRAGDRLMRFYVTTVPDRSEGTNLDFGEDPAWGPRIDGQWVIAYKGTDSQGNNPGLWLSNDSGGKLRQLTKNGNDRRPVWSPDGQYVVFMRDLGDGNWDLFRVSLADGSELRLTSHPTQDGLPTISPDGRWVAFASDRSGSWEIWEVALDGSSEQPVMPLQGVLRNWLEHAIQWVN